MLAGKPVIHQTFFPAKALMPRPAISTHSGTHSVVDLRTKLARLVFHHDELKIAFCHLNSQIRAGLLEAEDVFASLAIQLMKLVGLKTVEMATEGRFSSIVTSESLVSTKIASDEILESEKADENDKSKILEEENIEARAKKAGKELREKQKLQLILLVHVLKQIEVQVNASQDDIFQSLADHRASIQKYFQKAVSYVSAIHQECETNGMSSLTLKLLKSTYDHVGSALGAVEIGVEELMGKLAEKMCRPMVNYVNGIRYELTAGMYPSILAILEEMGGAIRLQRMELEEARKKASEAEKIRLDMLSKLKETEERMRNMKDANGFGLETKKRSVQHNITEKWMKVLDVEKDQAEDEKLLWELLRKRRKLQTPDSPCGPNGLFDVEATDRNLKSTRIQAIQASISCKRIPRRHSARLSPHTPSICFPLPLGSSPSAAAQQHIPRSRP